MKKIHWWQWAELAGMAVILFSVFIQLFIAVDLRDRVRSADDSVLNMRLQHIYAAVTSGDKLNPQWDEIEDFVKGEAKPGDAHWRFEEVESFLSIFSIVAFFGGSAFTLIGKVGEYQVSASARAKR